MNIGMLWWDNDPKTTFEIKVKKAAEYFDKKYGAYPNTCIVHPSMVNRTAVDRIDISIMKEIRPNYFWIGVE